MFDLKEQLRALPDKPGVYLMRDKSHRIIYVGKAVSLKNRVRQYFQSSKNHTPKVRAMVSNIASFEYIVTDTELEALILECNLIKENHPKYNVLLRDDKTYPYIKVTLNETYPRVLKTRKVLKDGAKYFGPYTNIGAVNETLEVIHQLYPIRDCSKNIERMIDHGERPCLNHHIKKCIGPCTGNVKRDEYMPMIHEIIMFLSGKEDELIKKIKEKMEMAAAKMDFERAAQYRDQVIALENIIEKQKIVSTQGQDQDVIAIAKGEKDTWIQVFFVRQGKLIQRENFRLKDTEDNENSEILSSFLKQFYGGLNFIPKEVLLEEEAEDMEIIEEWLTDRKGSNVKIKVPQRGEKKQLMEMVKKNAIMAMDQAVYTEQLRKQKTEDILIELQHLLNLDTVPYRIESYDISNLQGVESVGSMVVFEGGKPNNKEYRRFKIKTVTGPDDYGSLEEIVTRRFKRGMEEVKNMIDETLTLSQGKFAVFPDLIMVDGGHGQVSSVKKVLKVLNINIPVCGMIKDHRHRTKGLVYEGKELNIEKTSHLFRFITNIQDEVHRFAITYHRSLRKKNTLYSILEEIPGIGEVRRKALLKHFNSIDKIKEATIEELLEVKELNFKVAQSIYEFFHS